VNWSLLALPAVALAFVGGLFVVPAISARVAGWVGPPRKALGLVTFYLVAGIGLSALCLGVAWLFQWSVS
jgi:hypothetical protein